MRQIWKTPQLEVLDVRMTMKHHGGNEAGGEGDGSEEGNDDPVLES